MGAAEASDRSLAIEATRAAGALALDYFRQPIGVQIKADGSQVSEADFAVNELLRERLTGARPDYGWLSEESPDDPARLRKQRCWVVDPIDGTRSFLSHSSEWTISVALVEGGRPILGLVFNPDLGSLYEAERGAGAFLNGAPIRVSGRQELAGSLLLNSSSLLRKRIWAEPWPEVETRWVSSVAFRVALVGAGIADATLSLTHKSDWDLAAADLIVNEAGGLVTDHLGRPLSYNRQNLRHPSLVAGTPIVHDAIVARTRRALPEEPRPSP